MNALCCFAYAVLPICPLISYMLIDLHSNVLIYCITLAGIFSWARMFDVGVKDASLIVLFGRLMY